MFDIGQFLADLTNANAREYIRALDDMVAGGATGNATLARAGRLAFNDVVTETLGMSEVLGASIALRRASSFITDEGASMRGDRSRMLTFAETPSVFHSVSFDEAVDNMVERTPKTIRKAAERTAQAISELYSQGNVVAFVRSAEASVTKHVQTLISDMIREGVPEVDAGRRIVAGVDDVRKRSGSWSQSYARMAFRTNVNTAATAGRFRQARDPDIIGVVPAFRFDAIGDGDTRDNHNAADGIIMSVTNTGWNRIASPLGYNCRCDVVEMSRRMLTSLGRIDRNGSVIESKIPAGAFPDEGFRHSGRPDLFLNAVVT